MQELTKIQREILADMRAYLHKHGYPPTARELARKYGKSDGTMRDHYIALDRKGYIEITPGKGRAITIFDKEIVDGD